MPGWCQKNIEETPMRILGILVAAYCLFLILRLRGSGVPRSRRLAVAPQPVLIDRDEYVYALSCAAFAHLCSSVEQLARLRVISRSQALATLRGRLREHAAELESALRDRYRLGAIDQISLACGRQAIWAAYARRWDVSRTAIDAAFEQANDLKPAI
jgi:hypothetical protein